MANYVSKHTGAQIDQAVAAVLAGNVGGSSVSIDKTLTQEGAAADAKATGERLSQLSEEFNELNAKTEGLSKELGAIEPRVDDIPRIFYGASIPQSKLEAVMEFRYSSKTHEFKGYCETKAQGNSSMSYPKKNQTTKLFDDLACSAKHKIDFKGWGKQNKFCLKANWIDLTHARNVVSARIWGDVVKSRAGYNALPELLKTSPNHGAIDGFPVRVFADGKYQGRYTLNIPKDKWMTNMDDENPNHCILCGENYVSGCFRAEAKIDGSDWTDEVHDVVPDNIKTRWNQVINFVMTATDDEFVANLDNYIDVESAIDYYIFGLAICNLDGFGKNQLYLTYDGVRWYASVYDMDGVFGLHYDARHFNSAQYPRESYEDMLEEREGNLLYIRLASLFTDRILARWEELRKGALSANNIINHFEAFVDITPPYVVAEDYAETTANGTFVDIPLKDTNNIQQIRAYTVGRLAYVHQYLTGEAAEVNLWSLAGKTEKVGTFFGTPTSNIDIEYGTYSNGVNRAGYWQYMPDKLPGLVIDGDNVAVTVTYNGNSGYGIGVPIKLTPGASYKVSFDVDGKGTFAVMYYNAEGIYQTRADFNSISDEGGHYEQTFTMPDYEHAVFVAASNWQHTDPETTARFTNIKIVQL